MIVVDGELTIVAEEGSPRRCGGQGDLLAGVLSVAVYWSSLKQVSSSSSSPIYPSLLAPSPTPPPLSPPHPPKSPSSSSSSTSIPTWKSMAMASCAVRRASKLAYDKHGRSMTSVEVLAQLGNAFKAMGI